MKKLNLIAATIAGALGGAVIGMLFAPDKGEATREKIRKGGDEYLKKLMDDIETKREVLRDQAEKTRDDAKRKSEDLVKRAKKLTSYDEWTYDELYERAKEVGVEGYSQMRKAELIQALRNR